MLYLKTKTKTPNWLTRTFKVCTLEITLSSFHITQGSHVSFHHRTFAHNALYDPSFPFTTVQFTQTSLQVSVQNSLTIQVRSCFFVTHSYICFLHSYFSLNPIPRYKVGFFWRSLPLAYRWPFSPHVSTLSFLCVCLWPNLFYKDISHIELGPPQWSHLILITSLKTLSPNIVTFSHIIV